jgi:uncharacterized protein YndB with AHSA1/START domain
MMNAKTGKAPKKAAGIGDDAVKVKTGKTWAQWFTLLDKAGAKRLSHKEIALYVHNKLHCPPWWSQMVTVAYEQERGLREKFQTPQGYQTSASKTLNAAAKRVFEAWTEAKIRNRWLPKAPLTIRKATPHKSLRITWNDGNSNVDVGLFPKGDAKCQVAIGHMKLKDAHASAKMKKYWADALARLQKLVEAP